MIPLGLRLTSACMDTVDMSVIGYSAQLGDKTLGQNSSKTCSSAGRFKLFDVDPQIQCIVS